MKEKILKWLEALAKNQRERAKLEEFTDDSGTTMYVSIMPELAIEVHGLCNACKVIGEKPLAKRIDSDEYSHEMSIVKYGVKFYEMIAE